VTARDRFGNLRNDGEDTAAFQCSLAAGGRAAAEGSTLAAKVTPLPAAQYRLTYKANLQGWYSLGVFVGNQAVPGTPAKCEVIATANRNVRGFGWETRSFRDAHPFFSTRF
jgi:hypothetical protein